MRLALCGNPNVGKTTIFNRLTRSDAPVGNWHGVTVDVREKKIAAGHGAVLCDLPGTYSLTARSAEEAITRDAVLGGGYDAVVFVAEVNNLRRNLYLLMQVLEAGRPAALVVNMMDEARGKVDLALISRRLGIPVVGTSERAKDPRAAILDAAYHAKAPVPPYLSDPAVTGLASGIAHHAINAGLPPGFAALKLMERDGHVAELLGVTLQPCTDCAACAGRDRPALMRYAYIDSVLAGAVERKKSGITDRLDKALLGKAALPIFMLVMAAVFTVTFEAARPLSSLLSRAIELAAEPVRGAPMPAWLCDFLADGVIGGVGAVVAFLPQVVLLFLLTGLLSDSGYMSRVAFVTDGFFKRFGLSGRAAFSVILGLGCSATAVLSTRGISDPKTRRRAAFVTPFVPCSARMSVFTAVTAFFGLHGVVVAAMYVLGAGTALGVLWVMKKRDRDGGEDFLMEMPPYRRPSAKRVLRSTAGSVLSFVTRVGSVVLGVSAIMWLLSNFSVAYGFDGGSDVSLMSTVAGVIAPVFTPLGFGNWRAVAALMSGVAAKETLISVVASLGGMDAVFPTSASALSFLIFSCLYVPCVATLAALGKENGGRWVLASIGVHTGVAYVASLAFYGSALMLEHDMRLFITVYVCLATAIAGAVVVARFRRKKTLHST